MTEKTNTAMRIDELRRELPILRKKVMKCQADKRRARPKQERSDAKREKVYATKGAMAGWMYQDPDDIKFLNLYVSDAKRAVAKAQKELENLTNLRSI